MSRWDEIKKGLGDLADKTVNATRELTDTASLKIKIANKEADRDLEYKNLGKLAYAKLRQTGGDDLTEKISESLERLDTIQEELDELIAADKARKEAKDAEKQAREQEKKAQKQEKEAAQKAKKEESEKLNLEIMTEFNEARITANEEYEKAKQAAEDARNAD